jgi:hypothetical protein
MCEKFVAVCYTQFFFPRMSLYARFMDRWERKLASRDNNRVVREFDWGWEWLEPLGFRRNGTEAAAMKDFAAAAIRRSDALFSYQTPREFRLHGDRLTFRSAVESPYPENNAVPCRFFPARNDGGRAVLVLPQWNADEEGHAGLCRLLNRFGITVLRLTLAYHAARRPEGLERAEYHVSSNIGRTIHAARQSVIDARSCLDWLEERGYDRVGIVGTSLGSCIAFITAAHDLRVRAGVFNHVSMYFSDVVWTGLSTHHVRQSMEGRVSREDLRACWAPISPASYFDRLPGRDLRTLLVWARHDSTFLPGYSQEVLDGFRRRGIPFRAICLPCGHYTTGRFPFNWMDGLGICRFLAREL